MGPNKLSKDERAEIVRRGILGESAKIIAKDYGISASTAAYHIKNGRDKKVERTTPKKTKQKFLDMPLNSVAQKPKVAIIVTDSGSLKEVLGDLWK